MAAHLLPVRLVIGELVGVLKELAVVLVHKGGEGLLRRVAQGPDA